MASRRRPVWRVTEYDRLRPVPASNPETPLIRKSASKSPAADSPTDIAGPNTAASEGRTGLERLILNRLDDEKAQDIVFIDLKDKSPFTDALVIASGRSARHVGAMADHLLRALKDAGHGRARVEGLPHCDWVLIDAGDVIAHIFRPEVRAYYNIEKIWSVDSPHRRDATWDVAGDVAGDAAGGAA